MRMSLGFLCLSLAVASGFVFEKGSRNVTKILQVSNGGQYGSWSNPEFCPIGTFASGYSFKAEANQFGGDDTAMNAIRLTCIDNNGHAQYQITSGEGPWGTWSQNENCNQQFHDANYLVGFALQVEDPQGNGDDTSANYIKFYCGDFTASNEVTEINHAPGTGAFGKWGSWSDTCGPSSVICGLNTKIEPSQGNGDDTALNDVIFYCCGDELHGFPVGK